MDIQVIAALGSIATAKLGCFNGDDAGCKKVAALYGCPTVADSGRVAALICLQNRAGLVIGGGVDVSAIVQCGCTVGNFAALNSASTVVHIDVAALGCSTVCQQAAIQGEVGAVAGGIDLTALIGGSAAFDDTIGHGYGCTQVYGEVAALERLTTNQVAIGDGALITTQEKVTAIIFGLTLGQEHTIESQDAFTVTGCAVNGHIAATLHSLTAGDLHSGDSNGVVITEANATAVVSAAADDFAAHNGSSTCSVLNANCTAADSTCGVFIGRSIHHNIGNTHGAGAVYDTAVCDSIAGLVDIFSALKHQLAVVGNEAAGLVSHTLAGEDTATNGVNKGQLAALLNSKRTAGGGDIEATQVNAQIGRYGDLCKVCHIGS